MQVQELMRQPVSSTVLSETVGTVRDLMHQKQIGAVPIVELIGERILLRGIVTSTDLMGVYDDTVPIAQVMSRKVYTVAPEQQLAWAARLMLQHDVHHLIVVEQERIVGILSALDFVRLFAEGAKQA